MGLTAEKLREDLDALAAREPQLAAALARVGYPDARIREPGFATMLRTIVGQQVSVAAAASVWNKLEAELGAGFTPGCLLARDFETLRAWRRDRAAEQHVPPYVIFQDKTLLAIAQRPPVDLDALARIPGVGAGKLERYGAGVLAVVLD